METIKKKKRINLPLLIGIIDAVFIALSWLFAKDTASFEKAGAIASLSLVLIVGVTILFSFFLTKSYGACIGMILWGLFRPGVPYTIATFFRSALEESYSIRAFYVGFRYIPFCAWLPVVAGVLGILTIRWKKNAARSLPDREVDALIMKRSVFTVITSFYFLIFVTFAGSIYYYSFSSSHYEFNSYLSFFNAFFYYLGDGIFAFCQFFELISEVWDLEILNGIFEHGIISLWCYALLPTYLVYLGMHHPFAEKASKPLCIVGTVLTLATSIGVAMQFSEIHILLLIISVACILAGYFHFCKKLPEWSYIIVGCGFLIYAPLILLAVIIAICYFILKAFGKSGDGKKAPANQWEVTENGTTYIITESSSGIGTSYFDDSGREWKTDDGGTTFYRPD